MEKMKKSDFDLWKRITFKTVSYRKNFDLVVENEQFITEHTGEISEVRIKERKPPFIVGEYGISVWNFKLAKKFDVDLLEVLAKYDIESVYQELKRVIDGNKITLTGVHKLILIHNLIIHPDYRKKGLTEEFIEFLYRDFYFGKSNKLIALVLPLQDNPVDFDYYQNIKTMRVNQLIGKGSPYELIPCFKYYGLPDLTNDDPEMNAYKLFSLATRCGFKRINESYMFEFAPDKIIERIHKKRD